MQFIRIKVFAFVLVFCLMWQLQAYAQLTQGYKNGFVAATNSGIWYLQDGFDEWVQLKQKATQYSLRVNIDTATSVSFYKDELMANACKTYIGVPDYDFVFNQIKVFGYYNNDQIGSQSYSGYVTNPKRSITNKLKNANVVTDFGLAFTSLDVTLNSGLTYSHSINPILTSFASDNDSTLVSVGLNNVLYKTVISETVGYRSNTAVSGLTSNAASGHQICYQSGFTIVSDEGLFYSYDPNIGVELLSDEIPDCDSVLAIAITPNGFNGVTYRKTDNSINFILKGEITPLIELGGNSQIAVKDTLFLVNDFHEFYIINPSDESTLQIASLPSGTVVYDLDYIDYLPYVSQWDYEGIMTVGEYITEEQESYGRFKVLINDEYVWFGSILPLEDFELVWSSDPDAITDGFIEFRSDTYDASNQNVYIDGQTFTFNEFGEVLDVVNPFPPTGEPCTIKLKYTLQ